MKDTQRKSFENQIKSISKRVVSTNLIDDSRKLDANELLVCLTFDDSFSNLLSNVIPTITDVQTPITVFVPTGSLGSYPSWLNLTSHSDSKERILSSKQIQSLANNPLISFGSHTVNHPRLSTLNSIEMAEELAHSKVCIEKIVNKPVSELALPHGDYSPEVLNIAFESGYKRVYTLDHTIHSVEVFQKKETIGRYLMSPDAWPIEFHLTVQGAYTWLYTWRSLIRKTRFWLNPQRDVYK